MQRLPTFDIFVTFYFFTSRFYVSNEDTIARTARHPDSWYLCKTSENLLIHLHTTAITRVRNYVTLSSVRTI